MLNVCIESVFRLCVKWLFGFVVDLCVELILFVLIFSFVCYVCDLLLFVFGVVVVCG